MPTTITLSLGCLEKPISEQLAGHLSKDDADQLDRDNDAINRCYVQGYMPDAATRRARKKLLQRCKDATLKFTREKKG